MKTGNALLISPAEQSGNERAAALSADIAYRHKHREKRSAERNARDEQGVVRFADEVCVRKVMDQRYDHASTTGSASLK